MLEISWEEAGFPKEASAEKVIKKFLKILRQLRQRKKRKLQNNARLWTVRNKSEFQIHIITMLDEQNEGKEVRLCMQGFLSHPVCSDSWNAGSAGRMYIRLKGSRKVK